MNGACVDNPLVDFLRSYGPSAASDALYDEHVRSEVRRHGVEEIVIPSKLVRTIAEHLTDPEAPVSVVLTGTAGDGKTYHIRKVFLDELGGDDADWPGNDVMLSHPLPNGRELRIIRDLSEVDAKRKAEEFARIADAFRRDDRSVVYLIAANDGQLLKLWRDAAEAVGTQAESHREIYQTLSRMLLEERTDDPTDKLKLRLFNLSRRLEGRTLDHVVDATLRHRGWDTGCDDCLSSLQAAGGSTNVCPIRLNRQLLVGDEQAAGDGAGLFRRRLGEMFEISSANGRHVPIRQIFALVANIVLGDASNPDEPLLTCTEARTRAREGSYRGTNPYDNAIGVNLRSERRQGNAMFGILGSFGLGHETNNAIDDLLLQGRPDDVRQTTERGDTTYGERLFEAQRNAYVRGGSGAFAPDSFRSGMEAQRRRLFFRLPDVPIAAGQDALRFTSGLSPWALSVFHHGGVYLRFRSALKTGGDQSLVHHLSRALVRGMNRTLTGLMTEDSEQLWLAGAVGRTDDPTGRVVTNEPIPLAGGNALLHVAIEHDEQRGRPRLTVASTFMDIKGMPSLDLRPILFEYLVRVSNGSLPSSFSRQCHQEIRRFAMMLTQAMARLPRKGGAATGEAIRMGLLHVGELGTIQRENIEVAAL